jgi:3-hydroxyacyl-CoA dehydrogenase, NAD binding domain
MRRSGIAQVAATKGIDVILLDVSEKAVKAGIDAVERRLSAVVTKGKMTPPGRNHLAHQYPRSFKSSMRLASIGAKICWGMPHGEDHMVPDRGSRVQYPLTIFAIIAATNAAPAAARIKTPRRLSAFTMCLLKICPPGGRLLGQHMRGSLWRALTRWEPLGPSCQTIVALRSVANFDDTRATVSSTLHLLGMKLGGSGLQPT